MQVNIPENIIQDAINRVRIYETNSAAIAPYQKVETDRIDKEIEKLNLAKQEILRRKETEAREIQEIKSFLKSIGRLSDDNETNKTGK